MKKKITLEISFGEDQVPVKITCSGDDIKKPIEGKAMLLSLFDGEHMDTIKIDLWTKELQINEMDRFVFQSLRAITDTYYKATKNGALANDMQKFVDYFGEKTQILVKDENQES